MSVINQNVTCGDCGTVLSEPTDLAPEDRQPCFNCASKKRVVVIEINETLELHGCLQLQAKQEGGGKPFMKQKIGDDLHRLTGRWMKLERVIDRAKDWYEETITDPATGEVVRHLKEPLSAHQGHGSAKKRK